MDSMIFDLDGTLWDSRRAIVEVWNKVTRETGLDTEFTMDDFKKTMGLQMKEIGEILLPHVKTEERAKFLETCSSLENEHLKQVGGTLYPGVENMLKTCAGKYKLLIVSNCQDGYIESFFHYHNLGHYFIDYENPGRTGLSKGENIKLVIERNQLTAPIYIGDTEGDLAAARHAGIPFVHAAYGFGKVSDFDYSIEKPEDLLRI